jgi:nitrogen fixation/metabolism regulation signal transduction histidine kinase
VKNPERFSQIKAFHAYALLAGLPAVLVALALLWRADFPVPERLVLGSVVAGSWLAFAAMARAQIVRRLQTMANLVLALREGDYSLRARGAKHDDPLGEILAEINALGSALQAERRGAIETTALLRAVMAEIEVAVFAFDQHRILKLVNRAGERLLSRPEQQLVGRSAAILGLADVLEGSPDRLLAASAFARQPGRWGLRRTQFRNEGTPHQLVVIADLTQPLRQEELKAWQGLVRVLGHELNNSLAPIKSIAGSLGTALRRSTRPFDWEDDLRSGLDIIAARAEGLERFLQAYSRLARLPPPSPTSSQLTAIVQRVVALESRLPVETQKGPALEAWCDSAQIEQVLINLVRNAADAALEQRASGREAASVRVTWDQAGSMVEIRVEDDGPGIADTTNLFLPFFTTKPAGSGIGLVLSRQIAENHGGSIRLSNRPDACGCVAVLALPLGEPPH